MSMNNYRHAYFGNMNHPLNKSPSKTSYTFSKAQRFPIKYQQGFFLDIPQCKYHEPAQYQPNTSRRQTSPDRKQQAFTPDVKKNKSFYQVKKNHYQNIKPQQNQRSKNQSKSPLRKQSKFQKQTKQYQKLHYQNEQQKSLVKQIEKALGLKDQLEHNKKLLSPQKSMNKSSKRQNTNRVQTETRYLHQIDHVSKNITSRGYYPTGVQISPEGKYPISTIKNLPAYSFGKPIQQQRYLYINKYSNDLGPGYYQNYSQFGQLKKK